MLTINPKDNAAVLLDERNGVPRGHKIALRGIKKGETVIKYGFSIGVASADIRAGEHIHAHNLKSALRLTDEYTYKPLAIEEKEKKTGAFKGFSRSDGRVGIRQEIWLVNTVGCINKITERIAARANIIFAGKTDGVFALTHPYGCSQLGGDLENTKKILAGMALHPNAAGALVLGLGCENNTIAEFKRLLGDYDESRVKFLAAQERGDEIETALKLIGEIIGAVESDKRTAVSLDKLVIGLKCGGSDAFSGITANPLVGRVSDRVCRYGGTAVLTETPEMFGGEHILMSRAANERVFSKIAGIIGGFKRYFSDSGVEVYENPSPGNKEGGITTLEEKSLGCVQKGGSGVVADVYEYGGRIKTNGLVLLDGPGNDIASTTALTAAGCQLILFTTGRGTPLGAFAPTLKISSNTALAERKPHWLDCDAGGLLYGGSLENAEDELWDLIMAVSEGRAKTKSEINGCREFAIFKNGVTL